MFQFKAQRTHISRLLTLFAVIFCAGISLQANPPIPNAPALLGWGFEVGRANESDVEALLADQLAVKRSMAWVDRVTKEGLGNVPKLAKLSGSESASPALALANAKKWWELEVEKPLRRILKNPAASCAEVEVVFKEYLGLSRQQALLGIGYEENLLTSEIYADVRTRCHQEALDECNATGRYQHIFQMALSEGQQAAILNPDEDTGWVKEVLEECANYELHFVSDTDSTTEFHIRSVVDGRIPLKPIIEGEGAVAALASFRLEGEADKDPILQKLECSAEGASITCQPGAKMVNPAWAKIDDLKIKSKEFYLDDAGRSQQRPIGEYSLKLTFSPPMMAGTAVYKVPEGPTIPFPFIEVGATGFLIAHKKNESSEGKFTFTHTQGAGYPTLFEFTVQGKGVIEDIPATDTTKFELIHKPKKKPFPARESTPARTPLRPKAKATTRP